MSFIEKSRTSTGGYRARYRDPLGRQRSRTFRRKADAVRFLVEVESDKARGNWIDPRGADVAFATWAEEFLRLSRRLSPTTQETYHRDLTRFILPRFGSYRVGRLPADEIENWLNDELEAGLAPSSVHRHHRTLRRVLQVAVDKQRIVANPCDRADPPAVPNREMVFLDWDQALGLAEAHSPRFRAMVYLAVDSGMRWSELVGLRRAKLDLRRGKVRVSEQLVRLGSGEWLRKGPKTVGSVRSITVSPFTAEVLTDHVERFGAPGPDGLVFPNGAGNPVQSSSFWNNHFRPAQQRAGVTCRFHDLRHTSVSLAGIANSRHRPPTFTARGLERVGAGNDPDGQLGAEEVDVLRGSVRQSRREQRGATGEQEAGRLGKREEAPEHFPLQLGEGVGFSHGTAGPGRSAAATRRGAAGEGPAHPKGRRGARRRRRRQCPRGHLPGGSLRRPGRAGGDRRGRRGGRHATRRDGGEAPGRGRRPPDGPREVRRELRPPRRARPALPATGPPAG
jgi:integrase